MATNNDGRLEFKATLDDKELQDKLKNIEGGINDVTRVSNTSTMEIENNVKKQSTAFGRLGGVIGNLGGILKQVIGAFGIIAGAQAFFSLINNGIQSVIRFDKAMVNLAAIAGKTRSELRDLEKDIRKVAASSISTANDVADMATELIKLGTTPEGVRALLKPVNDLSIAFQASADSTAILLKGTLNAFQAGEKEAGRYADVMAKSTNQTALGFQEIADAFTYISASANASGYSIEQTAAMIGVLADNNIKASRAGRILSTMLGNVAKEGTTLEVKLDKVRNAQDKVAMSAKLFGAEGKDLGIILANNKDRVSELTKEFQNAEGSLDKLTGLQLESLSSRIAILGSAWEEFVLSLENGEGVLARVLKGFLTFLTEALNGLALLNKSMDQIKGERLAGLGQAEADRITELTNNYIAQRKRRLEAEGKAYSEEEQMRDKLEKRDELIAWKQEKNVKRLIEITARLNEMDRKRDSGNKNEILKLQKEAQELEAGNKSLDKLLKESVEVSKGTTAGGGKDLNEGVLKKRLELLKQINNIEKEINDEVLSGRELALSKIQRKYADLIEKSKELGLSTSKLAELERKETEVVTYKQDTESLKNSLTERKALYEEFEKAKKDLGEKQAKEMYSNLIDVSKNYYDTISDELDKIDVKDMSAKERDRYAVLMKMLVDYDSERSKIERDSMQKLYDETRTFEQKITDLRVEYSKKRADISSETEGQELENRLDELEKQYTQKANSLIGEFAGEKGFGTAITEGVIGATKQVILSQISSLRGFLKTASNLTKDQVNEIELTIKNLDSKLFQATDDGSSSKLAIFNNQVKSLREELKRLEEAKTFYESLGLPETNVKLAEIKANIDGINTQLDNMGGQKAKAISEEFSLISDVFAQLASNFGSMDSSISNMFRNLSKISNIASSVSGLFGDMKDLQQSQREGSATFGQYITSASSIMGVVFGVTSMITSVFDEQKKAEARAQELRTQSYLKSLGFERELAEMETERIRRNAISLGDRRNERESLDKEILTKQRQISELSDRINSFASTYVRLESEGWGKEFENLFGGLGTKGIQGLYNDLKALQESGASFTKDQQRQLELLDKFWIGDRSWQEVQQVLNNLTSDLKRDDLRPFVEEWIKLNKELEEAGYTIEDLKTAMRELATGTSMEELSDKIAEAFRSGEDAVYSFGQTMEEVLRNAVVASFKNEYIVKEMDALFKTFGDMGTEDGRYTQEEINEIRKLSKEAADRLQEQWDAINAGLDIDFGDGLPKEGLDSVKRITETQADRLTGLMNGLQISTNIQTDEFKKLYNVSLLYSEIGKEQLKELTAIRINTERTANNTDNLGEINTNIRILANGNTEQNLALGQIN